MQPQGSTAAYERERSRDRPLRVLRIYHAGVVSEWRQRERFLISDGLDLTLVSAQRWNEGGIDVECVPERDAFVVPVRSLGGHPSLFLLDPVPIWRLLRSRAFDLLDIHEEPNSLVVAEILLLRFLARLQAPVTLYSAQNIFKRYPWPFRTLERIAFRVAKGIHVCNQAAAENLRRKGFGGTIALVPLGVDVELFAPAAESRDETSFRVGYVGRLEPHKGVDVLLEAVSGTKSLALTIIGKGPEEQRLKARAAPMSETVTFLGFASGATLSVIYRSFGAVAIPSLPTPSWEEQFCRVAVEAMASGVPVVASSAGALPEIVDGAGLLVRPGDPDQLRDALRSLEEDPGLRAELGKRARARAIAFDWRSVAERQRAFYEAVLA